MNDKFFTKPLPVIPGMNGATINQIAQWYETKPCTIRKCYQRNRKIIDARGTKHYTINDFKKQAGRVKRGGYLLRAVQSDDEIFISNTGARLFSFAAIIQIGLLLRNSAVAQSIQDIRNNMFFNHIDNNM